MKIVIDARQIISRPTGGETVLYNVFRYIFTKDKENKYVFFLNKKLNSNNRIFSLKQANVRFRRIPLDGGAFSKTILQQLVIPFYLFMEKPDVYFYPLHDLPFLHPYKKIVVVYDLKRIFLPVKDLSSWFVKIYTKIITKLAIKIAYKVICISNNTKTNLEAIGAKNVQVIYLGVDDGFKMQKNKKHYKERFVLFVGENRPHKNVQVVINAFKSLDNQDYKLFIVGPGFEAKEDGNIKFCGVVSDEELVSLYNSAEVLVFPSLYEGFGLPIIEAMACGCPVIASNCSVLPETCGGAALLIEPTEENIAKAIKGVIKDKKLRNELRQRGLKRAKEFRWEKTAEAWFKILVGDEK